ncbi:EAL domain-containing protein [Colwellia psychrerythraea]|uniref:Diguanylate cyclase/phosphodiesterase with PAS/PAC sensor(S) n=1 Tax=Colwellia psychrerythraea TaxID=28229 RepID=A0A099L4K4_COLPS|nr:EAL domain-containing protein [Colwellia psychrerythraea]KGJ96798.1 diguanylate cyclase/phosphodiesterase with PAS/PAC sensor(s) [Colwellia psychrerythraea]
MPKSLLIPFLLTLTILSSVIVTPNSYAAVENLFLDHLSVDDGLSQGSIHSIIQDKTGFIWLATEQGLNIYDGNKVKQLAGPDNSFENAAIYNLLEDKNGFIWLNVDGKKLYNYNPTTDVYQHIPIKSPNNSNYYIADLINSNDNKIWLLTSKTLGFYNQVTNAYQQVIDLESELTGDLSLFKMSLLDGVMYMGSQVGIFAYDIENNLWKKLPQIPADTTTQSNIEELNKIYTVHADVNNTLYLGSYDGFFAIKVDDVKAYIAGASSLPNYQRLIENMAAWQTMLDGNMLYIAADKGLYSVNTLNNSSDFLFGFSDYFDNMSDDNITTLIKDNQGVFWLGSRAVGAYQWDPQRELIKNYGYKKNHPASLSYNEVWHALPDSLNDDFLWVATSNGLNLIDVVKQRVTPFLMNDDSKSIYTSSHIYSLLTLTPEQLLISTAKGVYLFDKKQEKELALPFNNEINQLLAVEQYDILKEDEFLWLVNEKGIFKINLITEEIDTLSEITEQFPPERFLSFLGTSPHNDWFLLTSNDGLWGFNTRTREFVQLYNLPGILAGEYSSIDNWAIDKNQIFWLSFSGKGLIGLTLPDFKEKYFYHKANSIIDNNIYGVMADEAGDIWFSSHNGLFMLDSDSQHISHFTRKDGLGATEFNGRAYTRLADGHFVYGSMEGISIFKPSELKKAHHYKNFKVRITAVELLSRHVTLPLAIEDNAVINLNYDDVGIRIDFSTFSYGNEKSISYKSHLSGENNIDYPASREAHITFPSLSSGKHTLSIQAKSPYTGEYSAPVHINFNVSFAPWRSPVAFILYFSVFMVVMVTWYRYRKKQQQLLLDAHEQVKYRENRLQLALTGSNSEVWDWQAEDNLMFGKRIAIDLGYVEEALFYSFEEHVSLIHPEDHDDFIRCWQLFISNANLDDNFSCTYRLKTSGEKWLWYKDLGKIVAVDAQNKPIRVTGSYTNITESRANEERAQYYGDAFQQTQDWVFIIDEKISRVTANQSMRAVFDWPEEEFDFNAKLLGINPKRRSFYHKLMLSLKEGEHWRGEELIITANQDEYHVIINVTVGRNSVSNAIHYLFVLTDISAQKSAENELRLLANYDHLTGLPNRTLLLERIKHAIDLSNRQTKSIALFFIDLDRFKQVNDSLGHDNGDLLLQEVAQRLEAVLLIDDTVSRIGGDEFVILLESFSNDNQLCRIADEAIEAISKPIDLGGNVVSVGASIGIAVYPNDGHNSDELLRHADVAMYHAKQAVENNFKFYTAQMNIEAMARLSKESALKLAVKNNEFINHYQPIIDAHTGKAVGVEMLMRWQTPTGLVPPNDFIPLSEELNLIITMTESALERACKDLKDWHTIRPEFYVSINLSVQHFVEADIVSYISELLVRYQLPAKILRVEVTENALILQPENAITTMRKLSALGLTLALDDFGTGFSSLSYLKKLPLDIIKIDRSFVSGIGINDADEAIVDTTLVLAKRLNMHCIAEGVETTEQLHYLVAKKCHYIQGYLYSKPISANEIMQNLLLNKTEIISTTN